MEKKETSAVGLHLVAGAEDGILTYSDNVADTDWEHLGTEQPRGAMQSEVNKELRDSILSVIYESEWAEED